MPIQPFLQGESGRDPCGVFHDEDDHNNDHDDRNNDEDERNNDDDSRKVRVEEIPVEYSWVQKQPDSR